MLHDIPQNLRPEIPAGAGRGNIKHNAHPAPNASRNTQNIQQNQQNQQNIQNIYENKKAVKNARFVSHIQNVTDKSVNVIKENNQRTYLFVQNNGTSDIFINFGNNATDNHSRIVAGGYYEPLIAPIDSIYLKSPGTLSNMAVITEGI